ncbi:MAG: hypothetical protein NT166_08940 [Candidatus Aminicenantes bacterium]|nr:hypothetical protein [Candidatus Aminicenantes bacterium]
MKQSFLGVLIVSLVLSLGTVSLFAQAPQPEVSLDDHPSNMLVMPFGPWGPGAPFVMPYMSAEDEFGLGLPASLAGFVGPSPTLLARGFFDSDVLIPGPNLFLTFPPQPFYMDAISGDHRAMKPCPGGLFVRFSVDRATGGRTPPGPGGPGDASYQQALNNEQPGDIFRTDRPYSHVGNFVPLPVPPPPAFWGGPLPTAGTGIAANAVNQLMYDHWGTFGFLPPPPCPPITPGSHDNVDAFHEWPGSLTTTNIFFSLPPASAIPMGFSPADIFMCPAGGGLFFPVPVFATSGMMGLDRFGFGTDSIDGMAFWDNGIIGVLEPRIDYVAFSLAPGSATLRLGGLGLTAGDVFVTDFRGFFCTWLYAGDMGVGNMPNVAGGGPLPVIGPSEINVDALDLTIDPDPVPYINPVTNPNIGHKIK